MTGLFMQIINNHGINKNTALRLVTLIQAIIVCSCIVKAQLPNMQNDERCRRCNITFQVLVPDNKTVLQKSPAEQAGQQGTEKG